MIVLDTSALSLALRRPRNGHPLPPEAIQLARLVASDDELLVPGIVLQELLTGARLAAQVRRLVRALEGFPRLFAAEADHVRAARIANACVARGITESTPDALIAALTVERDAGLFTTDRDFELIATIVPLRLVRIPPAR